MSYGITGIVSSLYLLGALSPHIRPSLSTIPAFLGLIFPLLLAGQLMATIYWLLRRRWAMLILMGIVLGVSWGALSAYIPLNGSPLSEPSEPGRVIKVLSYNTNAFGFGQHRKQRPNAILQYIKSSNADLVCLQESLLASHPEHGVTAEQLDRYLGTIYPYIDQRSVQQSGSRMILLSKYPIRDRGRVPIESVTNGAVWYKLAIGQREVLLVNVHLESFRLRQKDGEDYLQLVRQREAVKFKEAIRTKFAPVFRAHELQAKQVRRLIEEQGMGGNVIVCGDFNDTPTSYTRHHIAQGLEDAYIKRGNGFGFSYTTWFFVVRIDHILCGSSFTPLSCQVDASAKMSDHYPIVAELWLREQE